MQNRHSGKSGISPFRQRHARRVGYVVLVFLVCLGVHVDFSLVGWNHNLLGPHDFRQTQTALSTYYLIKEGFRLDYITPVLGPPWSIPFEFPLYQYLVAGIVKCLGTPLEQTGRGVSLLFFYLTLVPTYLLLGYVTPSRTNRLLILSFILVNPIYLFWSRAFLMESTALFFTVTGLFLFCWALRCRRSKVLLCAVLICVVASLVKSTTFLGYIPLFLVFYLAQLPRSKPQGVLAVFVGDFRFIWPMLLVPVALIAWVVYTDAIKAQNAMASDFLTSHALATWNFGTLQQRLTPSVWMDHILHNSATFDVPVGDFHQIPLIFILVAASLLFNKRRRMEMIICTLAYFAFPLLFTNLYFIHDYYAYANSIFLSVLYGLLLISILETKNSRIDFWMSTLVWPLLLLAMLVTYNVRYLPFQQHEEKMDQSLVASVSAHTSGRDVLLIYGYEWNPVLPYTLKRKCLMDPWNQPLHSDKIQKTLQKMATEGDDIGGMIIRDSFPPQFIEERLRYFKLAEQPDYQGGGLIFYGKDDRTANVFFASRTTSIAQRH